MVMGEKTGKNKDGIRKPRRRKAISQSVRKRVYEKYHGRCAYCGQPIRYDEMQVDHIEARYLGGDDDLANYNPACRMCNFYKSTKSLEIFRDDLAMLQRRLQKVYIYRLALRYGLVKEEMAEVTFYFEKEDV